jgi:hypothetical protein
MLYRRGWLRLQKDTTLLEKVHIRAIEIIYSWTDKSSNERNKKHLKLTTLEIRRTIGDFQHFQRL